MLNGTISGTSIKDEGNMSSDSVVILQHQQSIKQVRRQSSTNKTLTTPVISTNIATPASGHILVYDGTDSFDNKTDI